MRRQDQQSIPFADYLDAKFALDERSLNEQVRSTLVAYLKGRLRLSCLDVGSGTGAMVRRLLRWSDAPELLVTVLDCDRDILETARRRISGELQQARFTVEDKGPALRAESIGRSVIIDFVACRVAEFSPPAFRYDLITAHGFMDLVAPVSTLQRFEQWLSLGGLFYSTLNYDSGTFLFPGFENGDFEAKLLKAYDESMERRQLDGEATGGSRTATRLINALAQREWRLLAYGTSDWNLTPIAGVYRDRDRFCIQALLDFLRREAELDNFDRDELMRWFDARNRQLSECVLGLIVHQLDILAQRLETISADPSPEEVAREDIL